MDIIYKTNLSRSLVTLLICFLYTLCAGHLPEDCVTGVVRDGNTDRHIHILGHLDGHLLAHLLRDDLALPAPLAVPEVAGLSPQSTCQIGED